MTDLIENRSVSADAANWAAFVFDAASDPAVYRALDADSPVPLPGVGFWFISTELTSVSVPRESLQPETQQNIYCIAGQQCISQPIPTPGRWHLLGNPGLFPLDFAAAGLSASGSVDCSGSNLCSLDDATTAGIETTFYTYDSSSGQYDLLYRSGAPGESAEALAGYWAIYSAGNAAVQGRVTDVKLHFQSPSAVPFTIKTRELPHALPALDYVFSFGAVGGEGALQWYVSSGDIPPGLTLDRSTGAITGIPHSPGVSIFAITVEDSVGNRARRVFELRVSGFLEADYGHPYIQNVTQESAVIMWWTRADTPGELYYGVDNFSNIRVSSPKAVVFSSDVELETRYKHEIKLTGLQPASRYRYQVLQSGERFRSQFKTAPAKILQPISFIVWADPETELGSVGSLGAGAPIGFPMDQDLGIDAGVLATYQLEPDLILIAGDLVERGSRLSDWDEFFRKINRHNTLDYRAGSLASTIPIYSVPGNHDYYAGRFHYRQPESENRAMHAYLQHLAQPDNLSQTAVVDENWPWQASMAVRAAQNERYFSFRYGPATFIGLDTNNQSPNASLSDTNFFLQGENEAGGGFAPDWMPGSRQYQWLTETLSAAQQESLFTFVFFHQAPFSSGPHGQDGTVDPLSGVPLRVLDSLFHRFRVTAVFNGHDEMIEMSETTGNSANGGDPNHVIRYFTPGTLGDGLRPALPASLNPARVFHYDESSIGRNYGFLTVSISPDEDDALLWRATFRQAWIDPHWNANSASSVIGGYYDTENINALYEATVRVIPQEQLSLKSEARRPQ